MTTNQISQRIGEMSPVKQALLELREMRARLDAVELERREPIAIIGMGCRYPGGANNPDAYWQLLVDGVDAIREVPPTRWNVDEFYDPDPQAPGKIYTRWGGFLDNIDQFDPGFFGISPREAMSLDPQQRLLLEVTWEALENAGQAPDKLVGSATGVFIGISTNDYYHLLANGDREAIDVYLATGTTHSAASGRLSYFLGLQGPAISIDTACSSSLVTVHQAVQSLRNNECRMALAGGVNIILTPEVLINFSRAKMMAPDGRCKAFDARADGFIRSEGCGMIVLKRLSDAQANNDPILAVIRGSAVNQDGRSTGLTVPNRLAQEAVIRAALANGNVQAAQVSYVETHGTGTSLGDPIEVQALAAVYGKDRPAESKLQIGSVKTNLGHCESAAGIAGLMKAVLVLQHQEIPPHLHLENLNPYIPWDQIPVVVPVQRTSLTPVDGTILVGVSSFGFSGTNAHVVLETAPPSPAKQAKVDRTTHLLTLSAKQPSALIELARSYANILEGNQERFSDVCFTANTGRAHMNHRLAVTAATSDAAKTKLQAFIAGEESPDLVSGTSFESIPPEVAFLFTGHGSQYLQMGRGLINTQPTFHTWIEKCDEILLPSLGQSIINVIYNPGEQALLDRMTYAQPVLFAIEVALAQLWLSWGVRPSMLMGHSVGEYAAAYTAGAFSLEDGLKLVATRGRLMDSLPQQGAMAAVFTDEKTVADLIAASQTTVSLAAINGPQNVVISGEKVAIQNVIDELRAQRIKSQILAVSQAAHSPMLDPILDEFERIADQIEYRELQIGLVSTLTGKLVTTKEISNAAFWRRHLRQPVRFSAAMQTLQQEGHKIFVEIGPNPTLLGMGRRCITDQGEMGSWLPSLRQGREDWEQILESLAMLYVQGIEIDWEGFERDYKVQADRRRIPLPTYPWVRERYWSEQIHTFRQITSQAPLWQSSIEAGRQQESLGPLDLNLGSYAEKWQYLDRLTTAYIIKAFIELGLFQLPGETITAHDLVTNHDILPGYQILIQRWLRRLESEGYLQSNGDSFSCTQPLQHNTLEVLATPITPANSDIPILVDYVRRSGENLVPVLKGITSPLEMLFPDGSFQTAEYIYQKWPLVGYYNNILRGLLHSLLQGAPPNRKLRILEVGAGSGGTTSALLPVLPPGKVDYFFTDVSDLFLTRAEEKFQAYPFIHYTHLDLEGDPVAQGFPPHSFDIIVAANVLHATRDLRQSLANIQSLLVAGGILLAFEVTEPLSWFDVTTGLIEGWGQFKDGLRTETPLISAPEWMKVLQTAGFSRTAYFPEAGAPASILGSNILMAQSSLEKTFPGEEASSSSVAALEERSKQPGGKPEQDTRVDLLLAALPSERKELIIDYVRQHLVYILRLPNADKLDRRQRLMDLGVDSLMAVELRNRLQTGLHLEDHLPSTLIFDYPTIEAVAGYLEKALFGSGVTPTAPPKQSIPGKLETIETNFGDLSDAEVEALLLKKFKDIQDHPNG